MKMLKLRAAISRTRRHLIESAHPRVDAHALCVVLMHSLRSLQTVDERDLGDLGQGKVQRTQRESLPCAFRDVLLHSNRLPLGYREEVAFQPIDLGGGGSRSNWTA